MKLGVKRFIDYCIIAVFSVLVNFSSIAYSQIPEAINYQGSLSDSSGNPVDDTINITFALYGNLVGGATSWQETQSVVVTNGQFSVQLGADTLNNPIDPAVFEGPLFLGVAVDTDPEMVPRQAIAAVAYALRAKTVEEDTLSSLNCNAGQVAKWSGGTWFCDADVDTNTTYSAGSGLVLNGSQFSIPTDGINAAHIAPNAVGTSEVQDDSLTGDDIADGTITGADIANSAVSVSEIAPNSINNAHVINNSLFNVDLGDEGGGDFTGGSQTIELDTGNVIVRSVELNVPRPGIVIVFASGTFLFNSTGIDTARCSITTSTILETGEMFQARQAQQANPTVRYVPFAANRGFDVTAGNKFFRLVCDRSATSIAFVLNSQMSAIYLPTKY